LATKPLQSYVSKIEKETLEYLGKWGDQGEIDILEALSELTILTSSRCLHGDDVRDGGGGHEPFPERENECLRGHRVWRALFLVKLFRVGLGSESILEGG
jgi:cytochrome P450